MTHVLILAYDFPPYISIAANRAFSFYKYLRRNDLKVTVVTRHWSGHEKRPVDCISATRKDTVVEVEDAGYVIRVPFRPNLSNRILLRYGEKKWIWLRKILSLCAHLGQYYSIWFDNKREIFLAADSYIRSNHVDVIMATGEPWILMKYAARIGKKHKIPWIADYRDGWSTNEQYMLKGTGGIRRSIFQWFDRIQEKRLVKDAHTVTCVCDSHAGQLRETLRRPAYVVENGYDDEVFDPIRGRIGPKDYFQITYAGFLYPYYNLSSFLKGLLNFVEQIEGEPKLEVHFYGLTFQQAFLQQIINYSEKLQKFIRPFDRVSYEELAARLVRSDVLLLFSRAGVDATTGKIYDYFGAGRMILLFENDHGTLERMIQTMDAGVVCENHADITRSLSSMYDDWMKLGKIPGIGGDASKFGRRFQVGKMAEYIRSCVG